MFKNVLLYLAAILIFGTLITCKTKDDLTKSDDQTKSENPMKSTPMDFDNYADAWKEIDSLEQKQLVRSALEKTRTLKDRAFAEENHPQWVKAVLYENKYQIALEEDAIPKAIRRMEATLESSNQPATAILHSLIAELYTRHLESHYWQLKDRTDILGNPGEDILGWGIEQFVDRINAHYRASLSDPAIKSASVGEYLTILTQGKSTDALRPTLFDILAHRAIDHYKSGTAFLNEPSYTFILNDPAAFGAAEKFVRLEFPTSDSSSKKLKTLMLFQDVLKFHLESGNVEAMIDADLKRLLFVKNEIVHSEKEALYLQALELLYEEYETNPISAEIRFFIAEEYVRSGQKYRAGQREEGRWDLKKAYDLASETITQFPDARGAAQLKNLQSNLRQRTLQLQLEQVNIHGDNVLAYLKYRNTPQLYFTIMPAEEGDNDRMQRMNNRERLQFFRSKQIVRNWTATLPDAGDYQMHATEIGIEPLRLGAYYLFVSDQPELNEGATIAYTKFHISDLAFFQHKARDIQDTYVVVHRRSGIPLSGVEVEFYTRQYDAGSRRSKLVNLGSGRTDNDGFIAAPKVNRRQNSIMLRLTNNEDVLFLDDNFSQYGVSSKPRRSERSFLFLDRAIYRPGQTVHFKGYLIGFDEERMPEILTNRETVVKLYDVNYQEKQKITVRSNDFGTFSGSFIAPESGLLGQMSLQCDIGSTRKMFRVEEYKRPKFETKIDPVTASYRLNDLVTITGSAANYAGSPVDGAQVQYRVVRTARFPWWPWWRGWFPDSGAEAEIAFGKGETDALGNFEFSFTAAPDLSILEEDKPQFRYRITVDVTDLTGETRSAEFNMNLGYQGYSASIGLSGQKDQAELRSILLTASNSNGQLVSARGDLSIAKLEGPGQVLRKRYWQVPDVEMLSEPEYRSKFPQYAIPGLEMMDKWPVSGTPKTMTVSTDGSDSIDVRTLVSGAGAYRVHLSMTNDEGETFEVEQHFKLSVREKNDYPSDLLAQIMLNKSTFEPEETSQLSFASAQENLRVLISRDKRTKAAKPVWITVNKRTEISDLVTEGDRGNFYYHTGLVYDNRFFSSQHAVIVPWTNKQLTVQYLSYRNKMEPGSNEEWQIRISGPQSDPAIAEFLGAMYDASLDAFAANQWSFNLYPQYYQSASLRSAGFRGSQARFLAMYWRVAYENVAPKAYRNLNWFRFPVAGVFVAKRLTGRARGLDLQMESASVPQAAEMAENDATDQEPPRAGTPPPPETKEETPAEFAPPPIRKNLNETVFFFPHTTTNADGTLTLKFKMNEALTRWNFLGLAHTRDLQIGLTKQEVLTQKDLMVFPNAPRFFRQGDKIYFSAKVSNLTEEEKNADVTLHVLDATADDLLDEAFNLTEVVKQVVVPAGGSAGVTWEIDVPDDRMMPVRYQVIAQAGAVGDGEEAVVPVVSNRMLVIETMPLPLKSKQDKTFVFRAMDKMGSPSLANHRYTLEFTPNPAWYAVQALPYLREYPYECSEQIFSRLYANLLSSHITTQYPKIRSVFEQWKMQAKSVSLQSNLSNNQELKTALLEETPWVLDALSEEEQKRNIALLFDLNQIANETDQALQKLSNLQLSNGGFAWFAGGRDNWYITQYIVEGFGHLAHLNVWSPEAGGPEAALLKAAVRYTDDRLEEQYRRLEQRVKEGIAKWEEDHLARIAVHYLYARSFFKDITYKPELQSIIDYYLTQSEKYWTNRSLYEQGLIALSLSRWNSSPVSDEIVRSFRERSILHPELGRYWKVNAGYHWYQAPIERQSLMIEVFEELTGHQEFIDDLRVWLLKNKQTNRWKTTKATASAIYALLMSGDSWLEQEAEVEIQVGGKDLSEEIAKAEAGSGYFKTSWTGPEVSPALQEIMVSNPNEHIAWGAVYWQYFEDLDKIETFEDTPLEIKKGVYKSVQTDRGPQLELVDANSQLVPGDKLQVRIEIRVDRDMEFVHLKDMRASGLEPLNVLSQYKWQGGLGYYESAGDVATNFFMDYLPRGTWVFEYPLRAVHAGDFSNGITTMQCMYAPEFSSHSEGIRIHIDQSAD